MVIEACGCNWDIPGVDQLPSHTHYAWALVMYNGREIKINRHDLELNPTAVLIEEGEDVRFWVDWKEVARLG
jgi:hypothetical protein